MTRSKKPAGAVLPLLILRNCGRQIKQRVFPPIIRYGISPGGGGKSQRYLADSREWDSPAIGFGRGHLAFPGRFGGAEF